MTTDTATNKPARYPSPDPNEPIPSIFHPGAISLIAGDPGTGTSICARILASIQADGDIWMGRVILPAPVAFVGLAKDNFNGLSPSVAALDYHGKVFDDKNLDRICREHAPSLVVIDSAGAIAPSQNVNWRTELSKVMHPIKVVAVKHGIAILLVHRLNPNKKVPGYQRIEGSAYFREETEAKLTITLTDNDNSDSVREMYVEDLWHPKATSWFFSLTEDGWEDEDPPDTTYAGIEKAIADFFKTIQNGIAFPTSDIVAIYSNAGKSRQDAKTYANRVIKRLVREGLLVKGMKRGCWVKRVPN